MLYSHRLLRSLLKLYQSNPPESSSFDVFVKVGIGDIAVRNPHNSWLRKFSMYSQSLSYIFQTSLTLKAGCLPFYNLVHYYDSIFQKLVLCRKVLIYVVVFLWAEQKTERFWYDLKEKRKISEISEFSILPYTQDRKLGNLGNFVYLELWHWL